MSVAVATGPIRTTEPAREPAPREFQYPGIPTPCDGAEAVVHVAAGEGGVIEGERASGIDQEIRGRAYVEYREPPQQ